MVYDYLVVGAGLYGAVFAYEMKKAGKTVLVIDRRDAPAGNIRTDMQHGIAVHTYGAHIFHTSDREVWDFAGRFVTFNQFINAPLARYKDELYNLPFNMNTFSRMWGVKTPDEAKAVIEKQREEAGIGEPANLEEQALKLAGRDIYEKLIRGYTQKQWGRPCTELPAFIIRRLPFRFTYDNNYFNDRYQGIPEEGYTAMVEGMLEGVPVVLGRDFRKDVVREEKDGENIWRMGDDTFRAVLYTGMIDEYFDYCFGALEYRSLRFETEYLPDCDNWQGNAVVNYNEQEVPWTRIIEHKHFLFGKDPKTGEEVKGTVITREYPAAWSKGLEPYYPVNDAKNGELYEKYRAEAAKEKNVFFGGRLGLYRYFDMDKVIRAALDFSKEVLGGQC